MPSTNTHTTPLTTHLLQADDFEIEEGEVYAIDIVMSTGEGKSKVVDEKETTVFKRALDVQYQLKIKVGAMEQWSGAGGERF